MLPALGVASSAVDALKSLTSSSSPSAQPAGGFAQFDIFGNSASSGTPTASSAPGGGSQISPATMSALLAAQGQSSAGTTPSAPTGRSGALQDLFSLIDTNGDGQISKSEFEGALGAGGTNLAQADDVFSKLDKDGSGSVSLDEMSSALKGSGSKGHHHHAHGAKSGGSGDGGGSSGSSPGGSSIDSMLQALQGASSTSVTNSDGSTTTSLTYADGSKVTMTTPAATAAANAATSSYNFIEQMIQREAKAIASSAASLSVSA